MRKDLLLIVAVGVAACLPVLAANRDYAPAKDALQYDRIAINLGAHHLFSDDLLQPSHRTMVREPGYPIFLSVVYALCGHSYRAVQYAQVFLHVLTSVVIYGLACRLVARRSACVVGLLTAVLPPLVSLTGHLLTETLFTLLLALALWNLVEAHRRQSVVWTVAAGCWLGLAALCRSIVIWLWLPLALGWWAALHRRARHLPLVLVLSVGLTLTPWVLRNTVLFGVPGIRTGLGYQLWLRAARLDRPDAELWRGVVFGYSAVLGHALYPTVRAQEEGERILFEEDWAKMKLRAPTAAESLTPADDRLLLRDSLRNIGQHPFRYLADSLIDFVNANSWGHVSFSWLRGPHPLGYLIRGLYLIGVFPVLFVAMMAGLVRTRPRWDQGWLFLVVTVIYFNVVLSLVWATSRLNAPIVPYYFLLAFGAVARAREVSC
ncbi:MAG: glycosyltransferase family 39 protein [Candidatus Omnitrophica bacterium]|nr:glycosyltransferase family 39 protein [Candidatus Omnitrophota bacterium]